jgi:nicotinate-nucleotide pyrophosphorylase (carboxylating)
MSSTATSFGWEAIVDLALTEDIGTGDITTLSTVPADTQATGTMLAKQAGVISGLAVAAYVCQRVDPAIVFEPLVTDGDRVEAMTPIARVGGPARSLLTAERTALNLLQRLSGVATVTATYVARDGRLRLTRGRHPEDDARSALLEKHAVQHGGGHNHRFGLSDGRTDQGQPPRGSWWAEPDCRGHRPRP